MSRSINVEVVVIIIYFSSVCQSELSLASQEELTEVINFLSGAPIKLRLLNEDDVNPSMAESHMTPIDSGLGSIYSMAMSNVTQPSSTPTQACDKVDNSVKENQEVMPSTSSFETTENPPVAVNTEGDSSKEIKLPKTHMVTIETQTSPTAEVSPTFFIKPAKTDEQEQCTGTPTASSEKQDHQPLPEDKVNGGDESKTDRDGDDKAKGAILQESSPSSLIQVKDGATSDRDVIPENLPEKETAMLRVDDKQPNPNKTTSPVIVTVSSEDGTDGKISISESLRCGLHEFTQKCDAYTKLLVCILGTLRSNDATASRTSLKKVYLRSFSLYRDYSYPITFSNVGEPS